MKVYCASKSRHAHWWQALRAAGVPIFPQCGLTGKETRRGVEARDCDVLMDGLEIGRGRDEYYVRLHADQLRRIGLPERSPAGVPANVDAKILALNPSRLPQRLHECRQIRLLHRIGRRKAHQHADTPRLLRARRERPSDRRATEQSDELTASS